jgi:hypothetical protein
MMVRNFVMEYRWLIKNPEHADLLLGQVFLYRSEIKTYAESTTCLLQSTQLQRRALRTHRRYSSCWPSRASCNIDCTYCFFLSKESLYPQDKLRMSEATLKTYIRQLFESHRTPKVTLAWQGGEPTLMKLELFRRAVELVEKHRHPGQTVHHTFQNNGKKFRFCHGDKAPGSPFGGFEHANPAGDVATPRRTIALLK